MSSSAPIIICLLVSLLILSGGSGLGVISLLPPGLAAAVLKLRNVVAGNAQMEQVPNALRDAGPEGVLLNHLKNVDATRDPDKAFSLHAAIGHVLRGSGTQNAQATQHFEAARDAALQGTSADDLLNARIDLVESYLDEGRLDDASKELTKRIGVPDHFMEAHYRLQRARARTKFELGFTKDALWYFERAQEIASQPEDKVRAVSDLAMVQTCQGHGGASVEPLRQALEIATRIRKDRPEAQSLYNELAADVHFRLSEVFHVLKRFEFAEAHYKKAIHLEKSLPRPRTKRMGRLQRGLLFVEKGFSPELHCPSLPVLPWTKVHDPEKRTTNPTFLAKMEFLLSEKKYEQVEADLRDTLEEMPRPYKGLEAATALNMLGRLHMTTQQYRKAGKRFRQAMHATITCCGARNNVEAKTAFEGLQEVKDKLSAADQRVAAATMEWYNDVMASGYAGENIIRAEQRPQWKFSSSESAVSQSGDASRSDAAVAAGSTGDADASDLAGSSSEAADELDASMQPSAEDEARFAAEIAADGPEEDTSSGLEVTTV